MAYNEQKDKLLEFIEIGDEEKGTLQFSLFSYDGGTPRFQMVRSFKKRDGSAGYGKAGRISLDELRFLVDNSHLFFKHEDGK